MHEEAIRAAVTYLGFKPDDEKALHATRAAITAFLAKAHEDTDPEETARYCLLGQLRKEIEKIDGRSMRMDVKHTPGPWFYGVAYDPERGPQPLTYRGSGYYANAGILAPNGETIVGCDEYDVFGPMCEQPEREANCALLAASPKLLEALEKIAALCDEAGGTLDCEESISAIRRIAEDATKLPQHPPPDDG